MKDPLTTETEVCPHCGGTGVVPAKAAEFFPVGSKVLWNTGGWWGKVPSEVIAHSKSGQRVRIKYRAPRNSLGAINDFESISYVMPKSLEPA